MTDTEQTLQAQLDARNEEHPADYDPPFFLGNFRHKCPSQNNVSKAIDLKEVYVQSEDGTLAMIFREGSCKKCGQVARSKTGRFVDPAERPPISGRVAR